MHNLISWLYWDPQKDVFTLPFINKPIAWYGLFFVVGLIFSYWIVLSILKTLLREQSSAKNEEEISKQAISLTDRLTWFVVAGLVIGARLGHVFFYDWPYYQRHPEDIVKIWEGGLASHGGAIGILIAIAMFRKTISKHYPQLTFLTLADTLAVPTALAGAFIRIGNFFNQEILGTPSHLPWAVIFGHPADGSSSHIPRHPVQIYEAVTYFFIFGILVATWKYTKARFRPGLMTGLFFVCVFTARFILEFFKTSQSIVIDESGFQMGQYLSLPFIIIGISLIVYSSIKSKNLKTTIK